VCGDKKITTSGNGCGCSWKKSNIGIWFFYMSNSERI
jgi:hypothetical protein